MELEVGEKWGSSFVLALRIFSCKKHFVIILMYIILPFKFGHFRLDEFFQKSISGIGNYIDLHINSCVPPQKKRLFFTGLSL